MACNAWNHQPNCNCGWGGVNYGGPPSHLTAWHEAASFTTPNAHCPVCGTKVFFYRSPLGGSVFFDELGPPWPKHPCTDSTSAGPVESSGRQKTPRVQQGWAPFLCTSVQLHLPRLDIISLHASGVRDYPNRLFVVGKRSLFDPRTPYLIKSDRAVRGKFALSTLTHHLAKPQEMRAEAFDSLKSLVESHPEFADICFPAKEPTKLRTSTISSAKDAVKKHSYVRGTVPVTVIKKRKFKVTSQTLTLGRSTSVENKSPERNEFDSKRAQTAIAIAFLNAKKNDGRN